MLMPKVPFIISQPLTGFDICSVTRHRASGLQKTTSPTHISVAQVPTNVFLDPYHLDPGSVAKDCEFRTVMPLIAKKCCVFAASFNYPIVAKEV